MNKYIKQLMFGNQKQALRQNEAVANFIEGYLEAGCPTCDLNNKDAIVAEMSVLLNELTTTPPTVWQLTDKLFVQYTLGVEVFDALVAGVRGRALAVVTGETGKVVFKFYPEDVTDAEADVERMKVVERVNAMTDSYDSEEGRKSRSAEDEAWALIEKIIALSAPSYRAELPEDDRLAAILLSESYWKG